MDDASRGFICDLHLRASERLLLRIGDKAHDASRSNCLRDERRRNRQGNYREHCHTHGEVPREMTVQPGKPSIQTIH
jgi:hypothetical protein